MWKNLPSDHISRTMTKKNLLVRFVSTAVLFAGYVYFFK